MGGKSKHAPRTKNNAKPSSSASAAVMLGTTAPIFAGLATRLDIPFAVTEQGSEVADNAISPQLQIIFRKLSKKDSMTKRRGLQELIKFIGENDSATLQTLLPIWPKYYCNLSGDPDNNLRELAQRVLQHLVSKCKRAMAPYLKQLLPVWIASHFDHYAPVASTASNSFHETFAKRIQEVLTFSQSELCEFIRVNLTIKTPALLSVGENMTPEEAEQKYERVVISSLKSLSFFVRNTSTAKADQLSHAPKELERLLAHSKFCSFSKHKLVAIKAAWFEMLSELLQSRSLSYVVHTQKTQLIPTCFQNIDDADPLVAPHVWSCCLLLQSNYDDWYTYINMRKAVLPKLYFLLRNHLNGNAKAICPFILPFFANISERSLPDGNLLEFYKKFLNELLISINTCQLSKQLPPSTRTYEYKIFFECLSYLMRILNLSDKTEQIDNFAKEMTEEFLLKPFSEILENDDLNINPFVQHTSALVAIWNRHVTEETSSVYADQLKMFWSHIFQSITQNLDKDSGEETVLNKVQLFIHHLINANHKDHKVSFVDEEDHDKTENPKLEINRSNEVLLQINYDNEYKTVTFIERELKQLIIQLVRILLEKINKRKKLNSDSTKLIDNLRLLTQVFSDREFYEQFTEEGNLQSTLHAFVELGSHNNDKETCVFVVDYIFKMLQFLDKSESFQFIKENLLKLNQPHIQNNVLQNLLSYPYCIEPKVIELLATKEIHAIIVRNVNDYVRDNDKEKFNLMHKCFTQTISGNLIISPNTVDEILLAVSTPLISNYRKRMVDSCGSFVAQMMPVICSNNNSSKKVQNAIFLRLFKFTLTQTPNQFISEDTLWELTTCWQDALSSQDITVDDEILQECAKIIAIEISDAYLTFNAVERISEAMAKLATCSIEHIKEESERLQSIDKILIALLFSKETTSVLQDFYKYCLYMEGLKTDVTISEEINDISFDTVSVERIICRTALNFSTLLKLVCKVRNSNEQQQQMEQMNDENTEDEGSDDDSIKDSSENSDNDADDDADEITEDYCDPNENVLKQWSETMLKELLQGIYIASCANSLIITSSSTNSKCFIDFAMYLHEKVCFFMGDDCKIVEAIKERLMQAVLSEDGYMTACRCLLYLQHNSEYAPFEESAAVVLHENLSVALVTNSKAYKAYVNFLQYLLPNLSPKAISMSTAIMRSEPSELWIKAAIYRALIRNNFEVDEVNQITDRNIIVSALQFILDISEHNTKDIFVYKHTEIHEQPYSKIIDAITCMNLLGECIERFPHQLTVKHWDFISCGVSSWVLSISLSIKHFQNPKVSFFMVSFFKLYIKLLTFFREERMKSSTELLKNVIDEWETLFAREVNVVIFKSYYALTDKVEVDKSYVPCYNALLEEISPALVYVDYSFIYAYCESKKQLSLDDLLNYILRKLSSPSQCLRWTAVFAMRQLTQYFVIHDLEIFNRITEDPSLQKTSNCNFLNRFENCIKGYDRPISEYLDDFSFKPTELQGLQSKPVDPNKAFTYLLLWDCIVYACAHSPVKLREVYGKWLITNKYTKKFLHFLFRAMPVDILKEHNAKTMSNDCFKELNWSQLTDPNLTVERYACHLYTEILRKMPLVVRDWRNSSPSRQMNFIDSLTSNYVSPLICNDELKTIANFKDKLANMQVAVRNSTREINAVYSLDEAHMDLTIFLTPNYPLGGVRAVCGKQIGGREASQTVEFQLNVLLNKQNGTIFDALVYWKNGLDKKFEGVEECYICYTVIHQDTCQLPNADCKMCRKIFHGTCLYKWFLSSNKSTCPICRHVF